jgi:hypothetical protein
MEERFGDGPATSGYLRDEAAVDSPAHHDPQPLATDQLSGDIVGEGAKPSDEIPLQTVTSHVTQDLSNPVRSRDSIRKPPIDDAPAATTAQAGAETEPEVTRSASRPDAEVVREIDSQPTTFPGTASPEPQQLAEQQLPPPPPPQRPVPVPHFVAPSSYLRPLAISRSAMATAVAPEPSPVPTVHDREQTQGLVSDAS